MQFRVRLPATYASYAVHRAATDERGSFPQLVGTASCFSFSFSSLRGMWTPGAFGRSRSAIPAPRTRRYPRRRPRDRPASSRWCRTEAVTPSYRPSSTVLSSNGDELRSSSRRDRPPWRRLRRRRRRLSALSVSARRLYRHVIRKRASRLARNPPVPLESYCHSTRPRVNATGRRPVRFKGVSRIPQSQSPLNWNVLQHRTLPPWNPSRNLDLVIWKKTRILLERKHLVFYTILKDETDPAVIQILIWPSWQKSRVEEPCSKRAAFGLLPPNEFRVRSDIFFLQNSNCNWNSNRYILRIRFELIARFNWNLLEMAAYDG